MFTVYHRPRGPMDKASDFESEDCGFDPHCGHFTHFKHCSLEPRVMVPNRWMVIDCFSIVGSVVEFSPATRETGVRFPDNAGFSNHQNMHQRGFALVMCKDEGAI